MLVGKGTEAKILAPTGSVDSFLRDIRKLPVISVEEEVAIIRRIKEENDKSAIKELIEGNIRFIFALAKRYARTSYEVLDYVNVGVLELMEHAIDKYDLTMGYRFMTFGAWYLRRAMNNYMYETTCMVRKTNNAKLAKPIEKIKRKAFAETGETPSDDVIIDLLNEEYGINVKDARDVLDVRVSSINEEIDDDDYLFEDCAEFNKVTATSNEYEEQIDKEEKQYQVDVIISQLPEKHQIFIKKLFGIGYEEYSESALAEEMNITEDEVHKAKENIFKYIRQNTVRRKGVAY